MTIFDCLKEIITTKSGKLSKEIEFEKIWDNFMIVRYLSMDNRFLEVSQIANQFTSTFTKEEMYKFLLTAVPKNRDSFISYISKPKKKSKKELQKEKNKETED